MKKIVLIPDSFKGTMSSTCVCNLMKEAALRYFPSLEVVSIPIADGGEGTVDAFLFVCRRGEKRRERVSGPYGSLVDSFWAMIGDTAVIEMAACAGLPLTKENRNPCITTTYGVGQLIGKALDQGCRQIVVGLGGSGTNDGGCGMAAALGVRFFNKDDEEFVPTGGSLKDIARIDLSGRDSRLDDTDVVAICDTGNPLFGLNGAAYVFAPQKGADAAMVEMLDAGLRHLDKVVEKDLGVRAAEEAYGRLFERFENLLPFVAERTAPVFRQFVERGSGSDAVFGIAFVGIVNVSAYGAAVFLHVFHHV